MFNRKTNIINSIKAKKYSQDKLKNSNFFLFKTTTRKITDSKKKKKTTIKIKQKTMCKRKNETINSVKSIISKSNGIF